MLQNVIILFKECYTHFVLRFDESVQMSAQCWCYECGGRIVTRATFIRHGRRNAPIAELVPENEQPLPMLSMPPPIPDGSFEFPEEEADGNTELPDWYSVLNEQMSGRKEPVGKSQLGPLDITIILLDWMHTHRNTDKSSKFIWFLCNQLIPGGVSIPTFDQVKGLLKKAETSLLKRYVHVH